MYSTENPKRKTSSLSKMKERKDSTKTVEEKTKSQDKGKKKKQKTFACSIQSYWEDSVGDELGAAAVWPCLADASYLFTSLIIVRFCEELAE